MKKLLAVVLAASMALSVGVTAFATPAVTAVKAKFTVTITGTSTSTDTATLTVSPTSGTALSITTAALVNGDDAADIAAAIDTAATTSATDWTVNATGAVLTFEQVTAAAFTASSATLTGASLTSPGAALSAVTPGVAAAAATQEDLLESEIAMDKVIVKTPYVEKTAHLSSGDTVKPGEAVYYIIKAPYNDDDYFDITATKGDDAKAISKISVVEKKWSTVYGLDGAARAIDATTEKSDGRAQLVKIEFNEDYTDKEYKISFDLKVKVTDDYSKNGLVYKDGDSFKVEDIDNVYVKNQKDETDDVTYSAGTSGIVVKPEKNEDNTVEWEDNNDTIATLEFEADSDVNVYYPKLSTEWVDADYAENFSGTDAFFRNFVGNPTISSTSRPVLTLVSPFVDEDGEETVAAEDIVIYEVVDGALVDVTAKFTADDDDDGNTVFTIKTRTLGTYILSNGAAVAQEEVAPEEEAAPTDVKPNPGTGRF